VRRSRLEALEREHHDARHGLIASAVVAHGALGDLRQRVE
jgi:hypothetical protein